MWGVYIYSTLGLLIKIYLHYLHEVPKFVKQHVP